MSKLVHIACMTVLLGSATWKLNSLPFDYYGWFTTFKDATQQTWSKHYTEIKRQIPKFYAQ